MASASELSIIVKGDDRASGMMKQLGTNAQQMGASFQKAGLAMVAAGGAMLLVLGKSVKDWAAAGNEVQKMALRTNWAAESLSELRYVAEISGSELEGFEKSTRRMSAAIIDASDGLTEYLRDFNKLGLDVNKLKAMKPEDAFWEIATALSSLENELEQTSIAQGIFGRSGTQLLPMLAQGEEGIQRLRKEAHELGIVFDQEAADKAAALTDAMQRVEEAINGVKFAMAEALVPTLEEGSKKLEEFITSVGRLIEANPALVTSMAAVSIALLGAGGLAIAFGTLIRNMQTLLPLISSVTAGLGTLGTVAAGVTGLIGGAMIGYGLYLMQQNEQIKEFNEQVSQIFSKFNELNSEAYQTGQLTEAWRESASNVLAVYEQLIESGKGLNSEQQQAYEWLKKQTEYYDVVSEAAAKLAVTVSEQAKIQSDGVNAALEKERELRDNINQKAREQNEILQQQADLLRQSYDEQTRRIDEMNKSTGAGLGAMTVGGAASFWKTTLDMLQSGTNLSQLAQQIPGLLDYSLGQPSQSSIDSAIERAKNMYGYYSQYGGAYGNQVIGGDNITAAPIINPIDVTLTIDEKVLAEVLVDEMGSLMNQRA